ncbi:hypothetical protein [Erysipelothrix anatis]|nr:hypothetical protein [Erysipelothrix anatis]
MNSSIFNVVIFFDFGITSSILVQELNSYFNLNNDQIYFEALP